MWHALGTIMGLIVAVCKPCKVAEVGHERIGAPPEQPLDVKGGKAHTVQHHTGSYPERMGTPFLEFFLVTDGVEIVDSGCDGSHVILHVISSDEFNRGSGGVPVAAQRRVFGECWEQVVKGLEAFEAAVGGGDKTSATIGV